MVHLYAVRGFLVLWAAQRRRHQSAAAGWADAVPSAFPPRHYRSAPLTWRSRLGWLPAEPSDRTLARRADGSCSHATEFGAEEGPEAGAQLATVPKVPAVPLSLDSRRLAALQNTVGKGT